MDRSEVSEASELYKRGSTLRQIAKKLGYCHKTIQTHLRDAGIERRHQFRHYTLDEHYFDNIDTAEKAYWLGFLLADGNIAANGRYGRGLSLRIALQRRDMGHLKKLAKALGFGGKIKKITTNQGHPACWLAIISSPLCKKLIEHGWIKFKKFGDTQILNIVQSHLQKDLILGLFDGDGTTGVYNNKAIFGFIDLHRPVVEWVMNWLIHNAGLNIVNIRHPSAAYNFSYSGNQQVVKIFNTIGNPRLKRKKKIVDFIKEYKTRQHKMHVNIKYGNKMYRLVDLARMFNINQRTLRKRIVNGMDINTALSKPIAIKFRNTRASI